MGLTDVLTEGTYIWNSTGKVTTHTKWLGGQPDNSNNEDYVMMDWPEHGYWIDVDPTNTGVASLCERTVTSPLQGLTFIVIIVFVNNY